MCCSTSHWILLFSIKIQVISRMLTGVREPYKASSLSSGVKPERHSSHHTSASICLRLNPRLDSGKHLDLHSWMHRMILYFFLQLLFSLVLNLSVLLNAISCRDWIYLKNKLEILELSNYLAGHFLNHRHLLRGFIPSIIPVVPSLWAIDLPSCQQLLYEPTFSGLSFFRFLPKSVFKTLESFMC